jgi:hypothetical protein
MSGGGAGSAQASVQPGERLWRMIEGNWFQTDATGRYTVLELAFVGEVSLVRASFVTENDVDRVLDRAGAPRFIKYGIAELDADEIIKRTQGQFRITPDASWPQMHMSCSSAKLAEKT